MRRAWEPWTWVIPSRRSLTSRRCASSTPLRLARPASGRGDPDRLQPALRQRRARLQRQSVQLQWRAASGPAGPNLPLTSRAEGPKMPEQNLGERETPAGACWRRSWSILSRLRLRAGTPQDRRTFNRLGSRLRHDLLALGGGFLRRCNRGVRLPGPVPDPGVVALQGAGDRKQSLGNPGTHTFINRSTLEGHGYRRGLVRAGIVEFAVVQDGDGNQPGFSIGQQLHQSQRAWPLGFLPSRRLGRGQGSEDRGQSRQDDGPPYGAI